MTSRSSPASTRNWRPPRCGAARPSWPSSPRARHPTTEWWVSGTARARASIVRRMPFGTPTCMAPTRAAECCSWSATTRRPSPQPCPQSASARWLRSECRCCSRATPARSSQWPCTAWRCRGHRDVLSPSRSLPMWPTALGQSMATSRTSTSSFPSCIGTAGRSSTDSARWPPPLTVWTPRPTSSVPAPRSCAPTAPPTGSTSSRSIRPTRRSASQPPERHSTPCAKP